MASLLFVAVVHRRIHIVYPYVLTHHSRLPLSHAQFLIAVSNYTGAGKEDKLKFAFMSFDEDGNGVITKAELLKILKSNHMASHDAEVARKADTIMAQADKDGDGVITFDEFVIVSKKFPNILVSHALNTVHSML